MKKQVHFQVNKLPVKRHYSVFMFFCKKISMSTFSGERRERLALTISPAVENTLSLATEVPGTQRYLLACFETQGNLCWCNFHHWNGLPSIWSDSAALYNATSPSMVAERGLGCCSPVVKSSPNRSDIAVFFWGGGNADAEGRFSSSSSSACVPSTWQMNRK